MLDGTPLIDVHMHPVRLPTLKPHWHEWQKQFGGAVPMSSLYDEAGTVRPDRFDEYLASEGVDVALLLCEYSPRVLGIQPIEDYVPLARENPARIKLVANLNPHLHYPIVDELRRQLSLGAVALKIHPVHGGFPPNEPMLYPAYGWCEEHGVPVVFHCGTSVFPGSTNRFADPILIEDVARDFPSLTIALAHGGRGWWYDAAAFMALSRPNVWIELSGLPPRRLPEYYAHFDLRRLARKMIFGTDWPGVPGIRANAVAVRELGLGDELTDGILHANARRVYRLG